MMAEMAAIGAETGKRMIDTLTGKDRILFTSRLRDLTTTERAALKDNAEFWKELRKHMSPLAYWSVQLRLEYGEKKPYEVIALSAAVHEGDWRGARTLLMGYESLKKVPGLREAIASKFPKEQADDLRAILVEKVTRAESGMSHYKEAHYKDGVMKKYEGDRNYELVRTENYLRVIVRIRLSEDAANAKTAITDEKVASWEAGIAKLWNGKFRLRSGAKKLDVWFIPVFVYHDENAHHQVKVTAEGKGDERDELARRGQGRDGGARVRPHARQPGRVQPAGHGGRDPGGARAHRRGDQAHDLGGPHRREEEQGHGGLRRPRADGRALREHQVHLRYAADIVATFNAKLKLAGESPWTVEAQ